jgi:predicted transposase YdaD
VEVNYVVQVSWLDRQGQNLIRRAEIPLPDPMLQIGQEANFVPESGQSLATAQQELVRKMAQQIVAQMEMPW